MTLFWLLTRLLFGVATPSELFLDRVAPFINAHLFGTFIGIFGGYTHLKILGFLSVVAGQLIVGVAGALLYERARERLGKRLAVLSLVAFSAVLLVVLLAILSEQLYTNYFGGAGRVAVTWNIINLTAGVTCYALFSLVALKFFDGMRPIRQTDSRALFLRTAGISVLVLSNIGALVALYRKATFSYDGTTYMGADVLPITPNDRFYLVTKNVLDPDLRADRWSLKIDGHVACSKTFALEDLRRLPSVEQETTLMCISNPVGGGLMSNARWRGVPLPMLLNLATPKDRSGRVLLRAADGYTDTIYFEKAMQPTTIVAYEMNGEALPQRHGYPVRMIVPGLFGEKHVKWLTGIEIVDHN
ncbi:MAG: molybdopterin-dependent oxidoreductase, partial [Candidatus Eremiobacteraeota bacterium]|nr:molybdopterin-dependent oxidoreductase [Candidatus Eremiobacteraeota bacterium]